MLVVVPVITSGYIFAYTTSAIPDYGTGAYYPRCWSLKAMSAGPWCSRIACSQNTSWHNFDEQMPPLASRRKAHATGSTAVE